MLHVVPQNKPLRLAQGELAHTPHLPWLVRAVRQESEYAGLAEAAAHLQMLDAYGSDPWEVLKAAGMFDPADVARTHMRCVYAPGRVAFYPTAVVSAEQGIEFPAPARMSLSELAHHNERALSGLSHGRYAVSKLAREALGTGFNAKLNPDAGTGELALMEAALSDGSVLLGWGWVWHPHA